MSLKATNVRPDLVCLLKEAVLTHRVSMIKDCNIDWIAAVDQKQKCLCSHRNLESYNLFIYFDKFMSDIYKVYNFFIT